MKDVICIGAGISALSLTKHFAERSVGKSVTWTVLEKSRGVGGRVATRRWGDGKFWNMGPQNISTQDKQLREILVRWKTGTQDALPRFSSENLNSIPKTLWQELENQVAHSPIQLEILKQSFVTSIESVPSSQGTRFKVTYQQDETEKSILADLVVIHVPIPQAKGWNWKNLTFPKKLEKVSYESEDVQNPSPEGNSTHHWKFANVRNADPGFFYFENRIAFCGDGFSCGIAATRENGVERAWISGRSLAEFLINESRIDKSSESE